MPKDCLLLNGNGKPVSYFPLSTLDWKTAIKLIFTRNVVIVKIMKIGLCVHHQLR